MSEQEHKSIFLNDTPIAGAEADLLWSEDTEVMQQIEEIAHAILTEDGRLTFAVYGKWGAGKTSFLRMVQNTAEESSGDQQIIFCWYNASIYQSIGDPATTLGLRIWSVLGGEEQERLHYTDVPADVFRKYMEDFYGSDSWQEGDPKPYELLQQMAQRTGQLADFPSLLESHLVKGGPEASKPRKLVLVVDDLDRCSNDFMGEVVDTLQRLSVVRNLFVLIGVDRDVLLAAIRERYKDVMAVRDEHLALEKHIQCAVDLPDMTPELLTNYVRRLLEHEEREDAAENIVLRSIGMNALLFVAGVRVRTPRAIKRSINAIRPLLRRRLRQEPNLSETEQQLVIKEQVLAYNWRPFYQRYFLPAQRDPGSAEYRILYNLELLCSRYYSVESEKESLELQRDRRAIFELQLERIKVREFSERASLEISDELARLLAQSPFWLLERDKTKALGGMADIADVQIFAGPSMDDEFTAFYIRSEQADATGDGRACVQAAVSAFDLVRNNRGSFGKSITPQLGNLGVNAEKNRALELAEQIWRLALEFDPDHEGTLQQFASYIIDNRPDLYQEAEGILDRLQTGALVAERPWRTLALLVQLKSAQNQPLDETLLERLSSAAQTETDVRQLGHILNAVIRTGQTQQGVSLYATTVDRFDSMKSRYTLQRIVADALATRPEASSEFMAMDLYRQILASPEVIDSGDVPHVMHNYATLLYKHDYDDEAGCLWFHAYQSPFGSGDSGIRRAYSMYLLRADHGALAEQVINGMPVEEMATVPAERELPEQFSDIELPDPFGGGKGPNYRCLDE